MSYEEELVREIELHCPWCNAPVSFTLCADELGEFTEDCEVCCRPWNVRVFRDSRGAVNVRVERQ